MRKAFLRTVTALQGIETAVRGSHVPTRLVISFVAWGVASQHNRATQLRE